MSKLKAIFYEIEDEKLYPAFPESESMEELARRVYKGMTKNHVRLEKYQKDNELTEKILFHLINKVENLEKQLNDLYYPMKERK